MSVKTLNYKLVEFFILFVIIPLSFVISYPVWIKLVIGSVGFIYIIYVMLKIENQKFRINKSLNWSNFWKHSFIKLVVIALITVLFVHFTAPTKLFFVMLNKPKLWIIILFVYSLFSVYPQELLYRTFFFKRYSSLFKNERLLIITNAIIFSLAHVFFKNTLVIILTFIGGLIFAFTYHKTKSTLLVSIEHALYGCWLFTVGMGDMLGFPA